MPKVKKKIPLKRLQKKADLVFSKWIRNRDSDKCICCGSTKQPQAGHYVPRACLRLRYDPRNVNCQCCSCNVFKKGNMDVYAMKLMKLHGSNILYDLDEIKKENAKNPVLDSRQLYLNIIKLYTLDI